MAIAVAILEDDPATRGIVAGWIDNLAGFRCVAQYADAEAALAALPGVAPDVVLTDINLPEMNGIECVRQLKPQLPSTAVVTPCHGEIVSIRSHSTCAS